MSAPTIAAQIQQSAYFDQNLGTTSSGASMWRNSALSGSLHAGRARCGNLTEKQRIRRLAILGVVLISA
jgi:hypothetical protein